MQLPRHPNAFASRSSASAVPSGHPGFPASYERFARPARFACLALHRISTGMHKFEARRRTTLALTLMLLLILPPQPAQAYSVLSHEQDVDLAWKSHIIPLLRRRYPDITPDQIKEAHAYAYGGAIIQDIGYYPFGNKLLSDMLHYVRSGDFVDNLIREAQNPDEYAFALGALAHYTSDSY